MKRLVFAVLAICACAQSGRAGEPVPTEWMLVLDRRLLLVAPTGYSTFDECTMVASAVSENWASINPVCLPMHFGKDEVASFVQDRQAKQKALKQKIKTEEAIKAKEREQIPALEAERKAILDDPQKNGLQRYTERVLQIDEILRNLK